VIWAENEVPVKRVVEAAAATRFIEDARVNPYFKAVDMSILPPPELVPAGFPIEQVRIFGELANPTVQMIGGRHRAWVHVYRWWWGIELCLWTPGPAEPSLLQWVPSDGWEQLFEIIQRHLVLEEVARRDHGRWPVEDAHGTPDDYSPGEYRPPTKKALASARRWRSGQ